MKEPTADINGIRGSSSLWLLILLVSFFSSCTVRKGVQANFEIPVTKQLNPSKAVSNQSAACLYSEADVKATVLLQKSDTGFGFPSFTPKDLMEPLTFFYKKKNNVIFGWSLTEKVEFYILFRQMKSFMNHPNFFLQDKNQG